MAKKSKKLSAGTGELPLVLARKIAIAAEKSFDHGNGEMMSRVTPTTADLLKYWFCEPFTTERSFNFHEGQRQGILNAVFLHEVLGVRKVSEIYEKIAPELLAETPILSEIGKEKYAFPKYAIKMATGTGKTWVMHALLTWQFLNAKAENGEPSGRWTKNFLLVAPGIIVYERLLDAYCGRVGAGGMRDFETSDLARFRELFLPTVARENVLGFIQNSVVKKEEIGRKITGEGIVAVTNWHLFLNDEEDSDEAWGDDTKIVSDLLPARPGTSKGNSLEQLDSAYSRGNALEFLENLPDLMVVNDEAHHIHENRKNGEVEDVKWQRGLDKIIGKKNAFFQVDFSATPYSASGTGAESSKNFFPHIISDFPLEKAIEAGLVKMISIDKRKRLCELPNDEYCAVRDGRKVVALSVGQKIMLRAGLKKLKILEENFVKLDEKKSPKMLVVCEDTAVSPFVEEFLQSEGLGRESILRIDSNRCGEVTESEWQGLKQKLFGIDGRENPKVIISVLMLREGFDVNNICVIVPLRATKAPILLEQTIGRGLRLMWREREYEEEKRENRKLVMRDKTEPKSYLDLLSIIEHPAFVGFYDSLIEQHHAIEETSETLGGNVVGDLLRVGLKEDFYRYDLFWPVLISDEEETIIPAKIGFEKMRPYDGPFSVEQLRKIFARPGEIFVGNEILSRTQFGEYHVSSDIFSAQSYNEYLQKLLRGALTRMDRVERSNKTMPILQINTGEIVALVDEFIREKLFGEPFDPFHDSDWKILLSNDGIVTQHIIGEIVKVAVEMQKNTETSRAKGDKIQFSSVPELRVRERFSLPLRKTIYERTPFPSNSGGLEKAFLEFLDRDAKVERFIKISETNHDFAKIYYLRADGLLATYHPDFIIATKRNFYLVETKGENQLSDENVRRKCLAAKEWCEQMNNLLSEERENREWKYALLGEKLFYALAENGADIDDLCAHAEISENTVRDDFFS